jgi:hypothetical protein
MTPKTAIKMAIMALVNEAHRCAFDAAIYENGQEDYLTGKRAHEKRVKLLEAIAVLKGVLAEADAKGEAVAITKTWPAVVSFTIGEEADGVQAAG